MSKRLISWIVGVPMALVALVAGGTWGYIHFIHGDAPARLGLDTVPAETTATTLGTSAAADGVDGTWEVTSGSQAGYRVKEVLFGQSTEAAGRTDDVTGQFEISGTSVTAGSFTVDMTTVTSDESRRDNQFRGRIMEVATYPTAIFELTKAIDLGGLPADGEQITVPATGTLTLHGVTKTVTMQLQAQRAGSTIRVAGNLPIVFDEWDISNPSGGPAQTEDHGELEFLLVFAR